MNPKLRKIYLLIIRNKQIICRFIKFIAKFTDNISYLLLKGELFELKIICIIFIIFVSAISSLISGADSIAQYEKKLLTAGKHEQVNILIKLSTYYQNINLKKAVEYSGKAIEIATVTNNIKGQAEAYLVYANQVIRYELHDSTIIIKEKAYNLYMSIGEERLAANALLDEAGTTLMLHQYSKTNELVHKAIHLLDKYDDRKAIAWSFSILGQLYNIFDLQDLAIEYLNNSIHIYESIGETVSAQHVYVLKNLAKLGAKDKSSIKDLQYSLSVFKKNGKNFDLIEIYRGIADYYHTFEKNYTLASYYLDTALTLAKGMGDNTMHGILLSQYAWLYHLKGDYSKELDYNREALEVRRKSGFSILFASSHLNLGATFLIMKRYDSCEAYLKKGLELLGDTNSNHYTKRAFNLLYQYYFEKNDLQKALYYRNKEMFVQHQMSIQENSERISSLKMQLDLAESERNLSLLKHEKATTFNIIIIITIVLLLACGIFYFINYRRKQNNALLAKRIEDAALIKTQLFSDSSLEPPGLMYLYDPVDHTNIIINNTVLNDLGYRYAIQDKPDKLFWGLIDKDDEYRFKDLLDNNELGIDDNPLVIEFRLKDYFGDLRYFRSLNKVISENEPGKNKKILGVAIEVSDYKKYQENQTKQKTLIEGINQFIEQISNITNARDIYVKTADKIKEISGASLVCISSFDQNEKVLTPQHFSVESQLLQKLNDVLGMNIEKMTIPVSDYMLEDIKSNKIKYWNDIYEPTGGIISQQIAVLLKDMFSVREILGLSLVYNEEIIGAIIIIMRNVRLDIEPEILRIYANIASNALKNLNYK